MGKRLIRTKRQVGRPAWSPDLELVERLAASQHSLDSIAARLGINRATLFRKKKLDKQFREALEKGRTKDHVSEPNRRFERIKGGNLRATLSFLRENGWRDQPEFEPCPDGGRPFIAQEEEKRWQLKRAMTPEERERNYELIAILMERTKAQGDPGEAYCYGKWAIKAACEGESTIEARREKPRETPKPANRCRTGRPAWSPPDPGKVKDLAARGFTRAQLAAALGVDRTTLFRKMRDNLSFGVGIQEGEARAKSFAEKKLWQQIEGNNATAIIFALRVLGDDRFRGPAGKHRCSIKCVPAELKEEQRAYITRWTIDERREYLELLDTAENRLKAASN